MKTKTLFACIFFSTLIAACAEKTADRQKTPVELDAICANLDKITDKQELREMSTTCLHRSKFKPSEQIGY